MRRQDPSFIQLGVPAKGRTEAAGGGREEKVLTLSRILFRVHVPEHGTAKGSLSYPRRSYLERRTIDRREKILVGESSSPFSTATTGGDDDEENIKKATCTRINSHLRTANPSAATHQCSNLLRISPSYSSTPSRRISMDRLSRLASQRPVVIFSSSACCMCHAVKSFFKDLGVNYAAYELDEEPQGKEMEWALAKLIGRSPPVPAVFIGGKLIGPTDKVMSLHLSGRLGPMLRDAGAKWL